MSVRIYHRNPVSLTVSVCHRLLVCVSVCQCLSVSVSVSVCVSVCQCVSVSVSVCQCVSVPLLAHVTVSISYSSMPVLLCVCISYSSLSVCPDRPSASQPAASCHVLFTAPAHSGLLRRPTSTYTTTHVQVASADLTQPTGRRQFLCK